MVTSEPVVLHHGRECGGRRSRRGAAVCFNGLLGGAPVVLQAGPVWCVVLEPIDDAGAELEQLAFVLYDEGFHVSEAEAKSQTAGISAVLTLIGPEDIDGAELEFVQSASIRLGPERRGRNQRCGPPIDAQSSARACDEQGVNEKGQTPADHEEPESSFGPMERSRVTDQRKGEDTDGEQTNHHWPAKCRRCCARP